MAALQESNVVEVLIPHWDNVDKAVQIMQRFGEVGGVNVLNSEEGLLEIAYFDIRAARQAVEEIGRNCWFVAPCGNRRVRLPGTASLDPSIVPKISLQEMCVDQRDKDYYTLVFYDVRDAAEWETMVLEDNSRSEPIMENNEQLHNEWVEPMGATQAEWTASLAQRRGPSWNEGPGQPQGQGQGRLPERRGHGGHSWKEESIMTSIAEGDENSEMDAYQSIPGTYCVLLQGIPYELLNEICVDAILQQAGLANDIVDRQVKGREIGLCVLTIMGQEGVCRCLNHFAGCRWGARATLISGGAMAPMAPLAPMPSYPLAPEVRHEGYDKSEWIASEYPAKNFWPADDKAVNAVHPRVPKAFTTEGMMTQVGKPTSEASTEVMSESDEENSKLQGRQPHPLWYTPGAIM